MTTKHFMICLIITSVGSLFIVFLIEMLTSNKKDYPIKVLVKQNYNSIIFEADSVRGDTIYKDNIYIINKNIENVVFE